MSVTALKALRNITNTKPEMEVISRKKAKEQGLIYYFSGKLCPKNHLSKRMTHSGGCYECCKEHHRSKNANSVAERERCNILREAARLKSELYYFTGVECKNGHLDKRCVLEGKCFTCVAIRAKKYKEDNRDDIAKKAKAYSEENKDAISLRAKIWRENNSEKKKSQDRAYYINNKEKCLEYSKEWLKTEKGKLSKKLATKKHRESEKGRKTRSEYRFKRYREDINYKLNYLMSSAITRDLKLGKQGKSWTDLLDYTVEDLRLHLESKFTPEMNWNNHGTYWHIDHITPLSWFDVEDKVQFDECWSLNNLQPLDALTNITKGNKYKG